MDIFITQLAKLVPNKIEPDKLKVKALAKDAKVGRFKNALKNAEQVIQENALNAEGKAKSDNEETYHEEEQCVYSKESLEADADVVLEKDEQEKSATDHLDIFV